jgi:1-acyl-sn-glycerol-3-phosphate acyltransferase
MSEDARALKAAVKLLVRGFYRRIDVRGLARLPAEGPVLLTPNHPNSLMDSLVIGSVIARRVQFVAKHTLFTFPLKPLLAWGGVIPIRRRQDLAEAKLSEEEARAQNAETFKACFEVLDLGGVVGIFPEGITHDQPRLAPVKTGPARIALGAEERHGFALGLVVLPVGLHFPRKAAFRSDAVVVFGEPIRIAGWKDRHAADPRQAVRDLTAAIEEGLKALIPQVPEQDVGLVSDVLGIYADRLPPPTGTDVPSPAEADRMRTRQVVAAVARLRDADPALVARLGKDLRRYHRLLERLGLSDRILGRSLSGAALREEGLPRLALLILGFPLALYGLLNNLLASRLAALSVRLFARKHDQTMIALQRILGGLVGIPLTYALQGAAVRHLSRSWPVTAAYLATCPASGLFAWWYLRRLALTALTLEEGARLLTHRWLLLRLRRKRAGLRRELDEVQARYPAATPPDPAGASGHSPRPA